jgi:hypothetical protein
VTAEMMYLYQDTLQHISGGHLSAAVLYSGTVMKNPIPLAPLMLYSLIKIDETHEICNQQKVFKGSIQMSMIFLCCLDKFDFFGLS